MFILNRIFGFWAGAIVGLVTAIMVYFVYFCVRTGFNADYSPGENLFFEFSAVFVMIGSILGLIIGTGD